VSWIARAASGALEPDRVQTALARIEQAWPADYPSLESLVAGFSAGSRALPDLLAVSPASAEKIIRDPAALLWLSQPEICASARGPRRMRHNLDLERPAGFDADFRVLRRIKNREMLRIAVRDVARLSPLKQTAYEITCVAELCMREVCDGWLGEFTRRWSSPATGFCVIGMGKLGGEELNYSSDIDVIFLYGQDGSLNPAFSYQEFFTRLAEKIVATFAAPSADGALFRIDIRLRPEGAAGPLVRSVESMENYYAGFGETWERMALGKARAVAGSVELFYEFSHRIQPFIYPRSLSPDVLDEIAAIKRRIERDIVGEAGLARNVKLGRGGIREVEFVAQALQLIHGARHAFLQERNTLKALRALRQLDFIDAAEVETLSGAYRFLRDVEHRLQIEHEKQTHTLPEHGPARLLLARSLGFIDEEAFDAALLAHTAGVRAIFDKFMLGNGERPAAARDLAFFQDVAAAEKELGEWAGPARLATSRHARGSFARGSSRCCSMACAPWPIPIWRCIALSGSSSATESAACSSRRSSRIRACSNCCSRSSMRAGS
jgi:glutamate-ammonia-ligase adenylyltransferase